MSVTVGLYFCRKTGDTAFMADTTQLAQLIATRLCHDLAGPIGAVAAGVELVGDDISSMDTETLDLIGASSAAATHKLKFLRIAFGTAAAVSPASLGELENVTRKYLESIAGQSGPPELMWATSDHLVQLQDGVGAGAIQLLFNMIILTVEGMPKCGALTVAVEASAAQAHIAVTARGPKDGAVTVRADIIDAITDPSAVLPSARTAQALYAVALAHELGGALSMAAQDNEISATATLRPRP
ncbi:MAG: hypothetical protein KDE14_06070 [Rhodobacteraceae bacterium]|nr:hypothetical protein [Paracoccaceae bacterium]